MKLAVFAVFAASLLASPLTAQDKWQWSNLNPFKRRSAAPAVPPTQIGETEGQKGWKLPRPSMPRMPKLGNLLPTKPRSAASGPTAMQRFGQGAKGFFARTRQTITAPFNRNNASGTSTSGMRTADSRSDRGSFFSNWGRPASPAAEPPRNANDFLKLPRVKPE